MTRDALMPAACPIGQLCTNGPDPVARHIQYQIWHRASIPVLLPPPMRISRRRPDVGTRRGRRAHAHRYPSIREFVRSEHRGRSWGEMGVQTPNHHIHNIPSPSAGRGRTMPSHTRLRVLSPTSAPTRPLILRPPSHQQRLLTGREMSTRDDIRAALLVRT